jgi:ABC-type multidrug transport system fused ATPase/permease subunit
VQKSAQEYFIFFLTRPFNFYIKNNSSDLMSTINFDAERCGSIVTRLIFMNSEFLKSCFILSALMVYDYKIALILTITFSIVYFFIFYFLKLKISMMGKNISIENSKSYKIASESFGAIRDIIILNKFHHFVQNFFKSRFKISDQSAFIQTAALIPKNVIESVVFIIIISLITFHSIKSGENIDKIITTLAVFGLGCYKLLPAFQNIYFHIASIKSASASFEKIFSYLKDFDKSFTQLLIKNSNELNASSINFNERSTINFKNVSFLYESKKEEKKLSLKNINLEIKANSTIGIVGASGAGKSTFANLLLSLLEPTSGEIFVDNHKISDEKSINSFRQIVSFVPQNIFLFEDTIKRNVTFGEEEKNSSKDKFDKVCRLSRLDEVILDLKEREETFVGEKGIKLSGGQQQRIGIARALYQDKNIIFLDEATNALDGITESIILKNLKNLKNKTIFIISHNFSTIKNCDKILLFDKGKIVDSGDFDYLLNNERFLKLSELS